MARNDDDLVARLLDLGSAITLGAIAILLALAIRAGQPALAVLTAIAAAAGTATVLGAVRP